MKLDLIRTTKNQAWIGELSVNGKFEFFTLEPLDPIPCGIYEVGLYESPSHGYYVPLLRNVPGHTFIEIHIGNTVRDTKSCILVGMAKGIDFIGDSTKAFLILMLKHFMFAILNKEKITISISERG